LREKAKQYSGSGRISHLVVLNDTGKNRRLVAVFFQNGEGIALPQDLVSCYMCGGYRSGWQKAKELRIPRLLKTVRYRACAAVKKRSHRVGGTKRKKHPLRHVVDSWNNAGKNQVSSAVQDWLVL